MLRKNNRRLDELRPLCVTYGVFDYAHGSVFLELGKTKVLCAVTLQNNVPPFLRGKKEGWLSAQYAMLPTATQVRTERESFSRYNGRVVEISRLIGRSLRTIVDLNRLGERTILVDCDVIQADGGTRTACITGSFLALKQAMDYWVQSGELSQSLLLDEIAAVSVGVVQDKILLDLDYDEDSTVAADFNFVLTKSGKVIEMQGSAERRALSWQEIELMRELAIKGVNDLFEQMHHTEVSRSQQMIMIPGSTSPASAPKSSTKNNNSLAARLAFNEQRAHAKNYKDL